MFEKLCKDIVEKIKAQGYDIPPTKFVFCATINERNFVFIESFFIFIYFFFIKAFTNL